MKFYEKYRAAVRNYILTNRLWAKREGTHGHPCDTFDVGQYRSATSNLQLRLFQNQPFSLKKFEKF